MLNPASVEFPRTENLGADFWLRLLNDETLQDCDDLEKLLIGCELIVAVDAVELLAA